jgi:hypothetical protein
MRPQKGEEMNGLKMLTVKELSEAGVTRITFKPVCPDCARLKALLVDVCKLWRSSDRLNTFQNNRKFKRIQARLKQEGIE